MQTHYFELRAIPQIELSEVMVINQLMQSLHQTLVHYDGDIGISFPCYTQKQRKTLGGIIRLFGNEKQLSQLKNKLQCNSVIHHYAVFINITPIPKNINRYLRVSRVRQKGSSALKRAEKRLTEQGKWSADIQQKMIEKWGSIELKYPHCHLTSSSTKQRFILWVNQQQCDTACSGKFNSYGMSQTTTVPDF